jgi:predicted DsbA family dithiol-disulfide isomerase
MKLRIDVWSDIACPWCYVGKRHLEQALEKFAHRDDVELVWRSFQLDPSLPPEIDRSLSHADYLSKKIGVPRQQADAMLDRMKKLGETDGIDFRFDKIRSGNTFDAHRLIHFAQEHEKQDAMKERLFRGYFSEGESMGDVDTLARLAGDIGLDAEAARAMLASDAGADDVRADKAEASEIGVRGVPFFVIDRKYAVSGAQPAEVLLGALERAWSEQPKKPVQIASAGTDAEACGPDGCEVPTAR